MTRRRATLVLTAVTAAAGLALTATPSSQAASAPSAHLQRLLQGGDSGDFPGAEVPIGDVDARGARLAPLAGARAVLNGMGDGLSVSWTQYGTPLSLMRDNGFLATGLTGSPEQMARSFLTAKRDLFGWSVADVQKLELVYSVPAPEDARVSTVLLKQHHLGLPLAEDGQVAVSVRKDGVVGYVSSSAVPTNLLGKISTTARLTPAKAVLAGAKSVGVNKLTLGDLTLKKSVTGAGFHVLVAKGLHQQQLTRLRILPTTTQGARLVWETNIVDVADGRALGAITFVDDRTGKVLLRRDVVDTLAAGTGAIAGLRSVDTQAAAAGTPGTFQTTYSATACSPKTTLATDAGDVQLAISAVALNPSNDITIRVQQGNRPYQELDLLGSPEANVVQFSPPLVEGEVVTAQVCPFDNTVTAPFTAAVFYASTNVAAPDAALPGPLTDGTATGPATWMAFASNPQLGISVPKSPDDRYKVCSGAPGASTSIPTKSLDGCNYVFGTSRLPYDSDPVTGLAAAATIGNNAITTDARFGGSIGPGFPLAPNASPTRDYTAPWTDVWHTSKCDPASIVGPEASNVQAAIVNLFVGHNRTHDFAYRLGLTEPTGALQLSNYGKGGAEADPETGYAQNAAATNNAFAVTNQVTVPASGLGLTGRNNANQLTLQDGVPGITNQYLFQPVVGFYGPCADGDLDSSVFLHEYTHAISNRLVGGPDTGLSGYQAGSMGESWSDLVAIEYLNAFGLAGKRGEDKFSIGSYATGDKEVGIRDFNLAPSKNPLNYSDLGFDTTGPEVHADGEIWNATQMEIRQQLVAKYNSRFPESNTKLNKACAVGFYDNGTPAPGFKNCPGNRRYVTYLFAAMRTQANGSPSMLDMRDAELAQVKLLAPEDYDLVANAFAKRGMGAGAASKTTEDNEATPSFAAYKAAKNATVTFKLVDANNAKKTVKGSVFVGVFTARCTPIATTLGGDEPKATQKFLAGTYQLSVQAPGYGIQRFTMSVKAGQKVTKTLKLSQNVASTVYGSDPDGNAGRARLKNVFDDTEATIGGFDGQPVAGREIIVKFGGGKATFDRVNVSALHKPAEELPEGGTEFSGRLLGMRAFDLQARTGNGAFKTIYSSPSNFFPADRPRAVAPNLLIRTVKLAKPVTADTLRVVVRGNTCTLQSQFNTEQENDVTNPSDCRSTATNATRVTISEVQVLRASGAVAPTVTKPNRPSTGGSGGSGGLPATGGSTGLALGGMVLIGLAGTALVARRRLAG